jgi:hypothetical protein
MNPTTKLVLADGIAIAPVADHALKPERNIELEEDHFYVGSTPSGSTSLVVDRQTALLLQQFAAPATLVDAVIDFSRIHELDPERTLADTFATFCALVAARVLVAVGSDVLPPPQTSSADAAASKGLSDSLGAWKGFRYYEVYRRLFSDEECAAIISLHRECSEFLSRLNHPSGEAMRECSSFWIYRNARTDWIFARLLEAGMRFNEAFGFELSSEVGAAQLTRYLPGQKYDWHMDLGNREASFRKVSLVLQLSRGVGHGCGTEIFHGDLAVNRIAADIGDVVVFPSFVMHRAAAVETGVRWSLVLWLVGDRPLT